MFRGECAGPPGVGRVVGQEAGRGEDAKQKGGWEVMIEFNDLGPPYSLHRRQIAGPLV